MNLICSLSFIILLLTLQSCSTEPIYTAVSQEDAIELVKENKIDFAQLTYTDQEGNPLTDSLRQQLNQGKLIRIFYKNQEGIIDQVRLTEVDDQNIFYEIRIRDLQQNPFSDITYAEIDCSKSGAILERALDRDQAVRKGLMRNIVEVDRLNRDTIISVLDHCDWPNTKEEVEAIWYVIQHSGTGKMSYYYPKFKEMVAADLLEDSLMAKMEDRMLMYNGFPQLYGTQFTANPKTFHPIKDIHNVNARRKNVGLGTIEEKALESDIYFDWGDYVDSLDAN